MPRPEIPYNPQRYADEHVFVGRKELVSQLADSLESGYSYGLIGEPGIGKTSLLFAVKRELTQVRATNARVIPIPVYVEFDKNRLTSVGDILEAILLGFIDIINEQGGLVYPSSERGKLSIAARQEKFEKPLESILDWHYGKSNRPCRLIMLFDDLHRGIGCEWLNRTMSILRPVVSLGNDMVVVLSGELPLEKEFRSDVSPLRALVSQQITLAPLSPDEVAKLVNIAQVSGWEVEPGCEKLAYELTGGHPYRLHYYLFTALSRYRKIERSILIDIHRDVSIQSYLNSILKQDVENEEKKFIGYLQKGDSKAWERLWNEEAWKIIALTLRRGLDENDARDVCTEVFLKLASRVRSPLTLELVTTKVELRRYLHEIAQHEIVDFMRDQGRRSTGEVSFPSTDDLADESFLMDMIASSLESDQEEKILQEERVISIRKAIEKLDPLDRKLITLHMEGRTSSEIAQLLGLSEMTVRVRRYRILRELMIKLTK